MMPRACPVPACTAAVPDGRYAVFCPEHHCRLPRRVTGNLFALQMRCDRLPRDEDRTYLREQIDAYIGLAVKGLTEASSHVA